MNVNNIKTMVKNDFEIFFDKHAFEKNMDKDGWPWL